MYQALETFGLILLVRVFWRASVILWKRVSRGGGVVPFAFAYDKFPNTEDFRSAKKQGYERVG
jgi:hypothetical protein